MKKTLLLFALLVSLSSAAHAQDYQIPSAIVQYTLDPNGTVDVHEEISYYFASGEFSELYIQLPPDVRIEGETGHCTERSCSFRTQMNQGWFELVLSGKYSAGQHETAVFDYSIGDIMLSQKDAAQFFFKLWGDQWQKPVGTLTATVVFPGNVSQVAYFIHPQIIHYGITAQQNALVISSNGHPAGTYLEANILMPSEWFSGLPPAKKYMTRQEIIDGERKEAASGKTGERGSYLLEQSYSYMDRSDPLIGYAILFIIPLTFAVCYYRFGREKPLIELGYQGVYEREPPSSLSPAAAAYLIEKADVGNLLAAEIMNLAQNKFIALEQKTAKGGFMGLRQETVVEMRVLKRGNVQVPLEAHQKKILAFLSRLSENSTITSKKLAEMSAKTQYKHEFLEIERSLGLAFDLKVYLNEKGNRIAVLVCLAAFAVTLVVSMVYAPFGDSGVNIAAIIVSVLGILITRVRPSFLGKFNDEGRVLEARWQNFYKFLDDRTLMNEKVPADIILWEKYLIYATAFGISKKVIDTMRTRFPDASRLNRSVLLSNPSAISILSASANSAISSVHSDGGFGSGGGGGGGGGGAR